MTDNADGTYSATLNSSTAVSTANITATLNGSAVVDTASVNFLVGNADVSTSLVTASTASIIADGVATSIITVQLKDAFDNNLISGGASVLMSTSAGALTGVTDNNDALTTQL